MSIFDNAKDVSINGRKVTQMELNGATIWKVQSFQNQLPLSTDKDRTTIYCGVGFKESTSLSSSGNALTQAKYAGICTTGFIPAKAGDVVRVKGFSNNDTDFELYVSGYDANNTLIGFKPLSVVNGVKAGTWTAPGFFMLELNTAIYKSATNAIRICLKGITSDTIITINEEIP